MPITESSPAIPTSDASSTTYSAQLHTMLTEVQHLRMPLIQAQAEIMAMMDLAVFGALQAKSDELEEQRPRIIRVS